MFTCYTIDDDYYAIDALSEYIGKQNNITIIKCFTNPIEALTFILAGPTVDIIFMDIEMPGLSGIELARAVRHKTRKLIFTTAFSKYGYDAFEVNANAYLLKPFSLFKFALLMQTILSEIISIRKSEPDTNSKYLFVKNAKQKNKITKLFFDKIIAFESSGHYVKIITSEQIILTYQSLLEMKDLIKHHDYFIQVHRSFIISEHHVKSIEGGFVVLADHIKIPIGRIYNDSFKTRIYK